MPKLNWDQTGERKFELGVDKGVVYPFNTATKKYGPGVAWNGLTSVSDSPDGGDPNDLWADNIKYGSLRAAETLGGTIEAYTYPDAFAILDGTMEAAAGVYLGQQKRGKFGLSYRTRVGNDENDEAGYKLHLIYGCTASPSEKQYETVNDSPDAITFSWEFDTTPVNVDTDLNGVTPKPTASITIDSTKVAKDKLDAIEACLYGTDTEDAYLPLPDEIIAILNSTSTNTGDGTEGDEGENP